MRKHPWFVPSLKGLLIDLVIAGAVFGVAAWRHFHASGQARVSAAQQSLAQVDEQARVLFDDSEADLAASRDRFAALADSVRSMHAGHEAYLLSRVEEEQGRIDSLRTYLAPLEQAGDSLVAELEAVRSVRNQLRADLRTLDDQIAVEHDQVEALEQSAGVRESDLRERHQRLAALRGRAQAGRSTLGAFIEHRKPVSTYLLQGSRGILAWRRAELGLAATVGVSRASSAVALRGGAFVRVPLRGWRWSVELEAGFQRRDESELRAGDRTQAYRGAALRVAPLRGDQLRLLLGIQHRSGETCPRFGIAWGR